MATRAISTVAILMAERAPLLADPVEADHSPGSHEKAQLALRKRESELADLLENALEGVQRSGPDQKIVWANKAILNLLGYEAEEYIGHPLSEFFVRSEALDRVLGEADAPRGNLQLSGRT